MHRLFIWIIVLVAFPAKALTSIEATIDKNPVLTNESFVLQIVADDDIPRDAIDTSILLKNFVVGQTHVNRSTKSVNFKTSRSTTWTTVLIARTPGTYTIPAFRYDGVASRPISLTVAKETQGAANQRDIYIENKMSTERAYPGQVAVLDTKLYLSVQLERGRLSDPEGDGLDFSQMGEDTDNIEIVNGKRYRVISRKYAVSAEESGMYSLRPPMFAGTVVTAQARSFFDNARTRPVQVVSDDKQLFIMPIPDEAEQPFIPAEYITIEEQSDDQSSIYVGEPVSRKIVITANGISEDRLPVSGVQYPTNVNVYPDKTETSTTYRGNSVITQRVETSAFIATEPGTLSLPPVTLKYWDTRYHQMAEVTLPARSIEVLPAQAATGEPEVALPDFEATPTRAPVWLYSALTAVSVLWFVTLLAWWLHVRYLKQILPSHIKVPPKKPKAPQNESWKDLVQALEQPQMGDLSQPMRRWLKETYQVSTLSHLLVQHPESSQHIKAVEVLYNKVKSTRYGHDSSDASCKELKQALEFMRDELTSQGKAKSETFELYR